MAKERIVPPSAGVCSFLTEARKPQFPPMASSSLPPSPPLLGWWWLVWSPLLRKYELNIRPVVWGLSFVFAYVDVDHKERTESSGVSVTLIYSNTLSTVMWSAQARQIRSLRHTCTSPSSHQLKRGRINIHVFALNCQIIYAFPYKLTNGHHWWC